MPAKVCERSILPGENIVPRTIRNCILFGYTGEASGVDTVGQITEEIVAEDVGNFSESDRNVHLIIDWNSLGMDKTKALLKAPFVNDFQQASTFSLDEMIPIKRKEGLLLILSISK